jgi:hypothetical protein
MFIPPRYGAKNRTDLLFLGQPTSQVLTVCATTASITAMAFSESNKDHSAFSILSKRDGASILIPGRTDKRLRGKIKEKANEYNL